MSSQPIPRSTLRQYEEPRWLLALWHTVSALGGYFLCLSTALWLSIGAAGPWGYLAVLPLGLLAGLFLVKVFIVQHDCGHGAFTSSPRTNRIIGRICSMCTFVPLRAWAMEHNQHHSHFNDLSHSQIGAVDMLSDAQFKALPWFSRLRYRIYRHPVFMLGVAPSLLFFVRQRFTLLAHRAAWVSTLTTSAMLAALYIPLFLYAPWPMVWVFIGVWYVTGMLAVLLFYLQHCFEGATYTVNQTWDFHTACEQSTSFLVLPAMLNWFSGNIGYHHLHHLSSRIPFYNLPWAQAEIGHLLPAKKLTMRDIPTALGLSLWSQSQQRLTGFSR